ncbi:hypothetical protein [Pararhodospirillum oryzae]|uniref:Lipoprotein n=1 Tax=Pararhodospirillum oryzae TaxID=478448 RepID=A0A512HAX0_9PROT|nr:hypothetical protein [Pararhodospirillum oryzae]GEO82578.1 hypothetical protein ROR02_27090 [Pararhodospirillum oryzae]
MGGFKAWRLLGVVGTVLLAAGCASTGDIGNPLVRKATWYSYLNGDDLRAGCEVNDSDTVRLVFNGIYTEEVRVYEAHAGAGGRWLSGRRIPGAVDLSALTLDRPGAVLDPWRGESQVVPLNEGQWKALIETLRADGVGQPPPVGLSLESDDHYWIASGCLDRHVVFQAWARRQPAYQTLRFNDLLLSWLPLGGALPSYARADRGSFEEERRRQFHFALRVGPDGLRDDPWAP